MKTILAMVLIVVLVSSCGTTMAACKQYNEAVERGEAERMEHPGYDLEHAAWITLAWAHLYFCTYQAAR